MNCYASASGKSHHIRLTKSPKWSSTLRVIKNVWSGVSHGWLRYESQMNKYVVIGFQQGKLFFNNVKYPVGSKA
jgi:hypothetical protein